LDYSCELCGHDEFQEIVILRDYTNYQPVHSCKDCGFVQVLERRTPKEIYEAWKNADPGDDVYKSARPAVAARHAYAAWFIKEHLDPELMLDMGSGDGMFSRQKIPFLVDNWPGMAEEYSGEKYEAVSLLWTLENCGSANSVLRAAREALHPGGHIVVATGSRLMVPFRKPLNEYIDDSPADMHPWRFSANTLKAILARNGFMPVRVNRFLSSEYLIVIARKENSEQPWRGDDYMAPVIFFNRWHKETLQYWT